MDDFLESKDKIAEKISKKTGKGIEELDKLIETKKEKFSGLLTDSGAAFMVAKDLGMDLNLEDKINPKLKINQLEDGMNSVDLEAEISLIYPEKEFEKNGRKGKLSSIILQDNTGDIRLTLWNNHVDKFNELNAREGAKLLIKNCFVSSYNEKMQLNISSSDSIELLQNKELAFEKTDSLKENMSQINIKGKIGRVFEKRVFNTGQRQGEVQNFEFLDDKGKIRGTAWNEKTKLIEKLENQTVEILNAYTKQGMKGIELHLNWKTRVNPAKIDFTVQESAGSSYIEKKLNEIEEQDNVEVNGTIVALNNSKLIFVTCPKCRKKVDVVEEKYLCQKCGEIEGKKNLVQSFDLDDGFGVARIVCFESQAEKLLKTEIPEVEKEIETGTAAFIESKRKELVGQRVSIKGYVKKNQRSEELEIICNEFKEADSKELLDITMNKIE